MPNASIYTEKKGEYMLYGIPNMTSVSTVTRGLPFNSRRVWKRGWLGNIGLLYPDIPGPDFEAGKIPPDRPGNYYGIVVQNMRSNLRRQISLMEVVNVCQLVCNAQ
jgi:hypothetical protein